MESSELASLSAVTSNPGERERGGLQLHTI